MTVVPAVTAATPALAAPAPGFTVATVATDTAVKSDRRAMAGGAHDAAAGRTFVSWIGRSAHPYVTAHDHRAGTWSAPVRHSVQQLATSPPHIAGEWTDRQLPVAPRSSYPMPVKASNGDIYLFHRDTPHEDDPAKFTDDRPMHYLLSTNRGDTWHHRADRRRNYPTLPN